MANIDCAPLVDRSIGNQYNFHNFIDNSRSATIRVSKKETWGVDGYYVPHTDMYWKKPKTFSSKMKKENFIEIEAKRKKEIPAPSAYNFDAKKLWTGLYRDCSGHSGKWLSSSKTTYIDNILKQKKLKLPGPGTYKIPDFKPKNWPK